jgi:hypothetical protein
MRPPGGGSAALAWVTRDDYVSSLAIREMQPASELSVS